MKTKKTQSLKKALALALLAHAAAFTCRAQQQSDKQAQPPAQSQTSARPSEAAGGAREKDAREKGSGSIKGRVVGEAGEPLPGVSVFVAQRGYTQFYRPQRTITDDEGNFTITGLDPGLYSISANMPGYVTDTDPSTNRPAAYRPGDNASVRLVKGGVITGAVTNPQGEPVVAISVRAYRVRDADGRPIPPLGYNYGSEDNTDDRGVYRIYGLTPGVYVVSAGTGRDVFFAWTSAYVGNAATFYPSATRDTASEVTVRAGQENAGVDIHYRDEPGRRVTGRVELPEGTQPEPGTGVNVTLAYASSGMQAGSTYVQPSANALSFSFEGVSDGEYDLQATLGGREGQTGAAPPQRVTVRGADVTGLRLTLAPLASVSGTLVIEQPTAAERAREMCKQQRPSMLPQETLVTLAADRPAPAKGQAVTRTSVGREAVPDGSGAFTLRSLEPGRYRIAARSFDDALYVRSVQLPAAAVVTTTRDALDVRTGRQVSGVSVRLAEGAAQLSGRVVASEGSAVPPFTQLRVHLVPAERESADDPLRYFDATPDGSGAFTFKSLPPGRYFVVTRPAPEPSVDTPPRPAYWDADSRARLRREAEAANAPVELQPCQRTTDFTLRLPK